MDKTTKKNQENKPNITPKTYFAFLRFTFSEMIRKRKWALIPVWIILAIVAILLIVSGNTFLLPAIYIAF